MGREAYRRNRQIIDITDFDEIDFDETIQVGIPKFAWLVARSYLSLQAQWLTSYAVEYFPNGYDTPSAAQMDTVKESLAEFLAAEAEVPNFIVGQIVMYGGGFLPDGFLWCNGQTFDAFEYTELYSVIGYTFGVESGDPKLPDLGERFPVGGSISHPRGETGGAGEHALTEAEMPSHGHRIRTEGNSGFNFQTAIVGGLTPGSYQGAGTIEETGDGDAHNNMPPYLAINFIIYAGA